MLIFIRAFFIITITIVTGCATNTDFSSTPMYESDFNKPLIEIRNNFSDVAKFEDEYKWEWKWTFSSLPDTGKLSTLENKGGKAEKVQTHWKPKIFSTLLNTALITLIGWSTYVFVITEAMFLLPHETHQWKKGDTIISATVSRLGFSGYEKRIGYWEWTKTTKNIHKNTKLSTTSRD